MRLVHAHVPDLVVIGIEDRDPVRPLQHLHADVPQDKWHAAGPALVARRRIGHAGRRDFTVLSDDIRSVRLEDRVRIVADELVVVAAPLRRDRLVIGPGPAGGVSKSGHVRCAQIPEKSGTAIAPMPHGRSQRPSAEPPAPTPIRSRLPPGTPPPERNVAAAVRMSPPTITWLNQYALSFPPATTTCN